MFNEQPSCGGNEDARVKKELLGDQDQLNRFVRALFKNADRETYIALRIFPDAGEHGKAIRKLNIKVGAPELEGQLFGFACEAANWPKPSVFSPPICTFNDPDRARTRDLADGITLSVECDARPCEALETLAKLIGRPTLVVASGGVWTNAESGEKQDKLHLHWRLAIPARGSHEHQQLKLLRALACRLVDGDRTSISAVHPIRIAGSWHRKATPRLATIIEENDVEIDLFDARDKLAAAVPKEVLDDLQRVAKSNPELQAATADIAAAMDEIKNIGDWEFWNRIGMANFSATDGDGFEAWDKFSQQSDRYDAEYTEARWNHYYASPPDRIGAGTIFYMAGEAVEGWEKPSDVARRKAKQAEILERFFERDTFGMAKEADADDGTKVNGDGATEQPSGEQPGTRAKAETFETLTIDEILTRPNPQYLIARHIPEKSLGFLYGDPAAGKSFIALDWALHLAYGFDAWNGDPISQRDGGTVIFVTGGEGQAGMKARMAAWLHAHRIDDHRRGRFRLIPQTVSFLSGDDMLKLVATLQQDIGGPISLLVIDTVSRALPGADENLQKEMTTFVRNCDNLKTLFSCCVLGVHHASKTGDMRGSTVLRGAGDFVFQLDRTKGDAVGALSCEKQKDAPDGWKERYRFDKVFLPDGSTSLVPVRVAKCEAEPEATAPDTKLSASAKILMKALDEEAGEDSAPVSEKQLKTRFCQIYPNDSSEAQRKQFRRVLPALVADGLIKSFQIDGLNHYCRSSPDTRTDGTSP